MTKNEKQLLRILYMQVVSVADLLKSYYETEPSEDRIEKLKKYKAQAEILWELIDTLGIEFDHPVTNLYDCYFMK